MNKGILGGIAVAGLIAGIAHAEVLEIRGELAADLQHFGMRDPGDQAGDGDAAKNPLVHFTFPQKVVAGAVYHTKRFGTCP